MNIYFLIPDFNHLNDDSIVYLAEGLKDLNIPFYSNRNYWQLNSQGDFLFNENKDFDPVQDADVVILSYKWNEHMDPDSFRYCSLPIPSWLLDPSRKFISVYLDPRDGYNTVSYTPEFRKFDFIFRSKMNKRTLNYTNIYPWVLGYQSRIIAEKKGILTFEKKYQIAVNFYFSHKYTHQLRAPAEKDFISKFDPKLITRKSTSKDRPENPYSAIMWDNTYGLHNPSYFNHIEETLMVAAFCGELIPGLPRNPSSYLVGGKKAELKKNLFSFLSSVGKINPRLIQWDSWRFWETLVLGSVPIHIDLDKYGVELPVMPENWRHYIGIDLNNINYSVERIIEDKETLFSIAEEGNKWCISNYSPVASAKRFLETINLKF